MALKIEPASTIKITLGLNPNGPIQWFFTNTCYKRMDKYVPMDKGDLRKEHTLTATSITYEVPYSTIQYEGIIHGKKVPSENYTTPGTGPKWDEEMLKNEREQLEEDVQRFASRYGK